VRTTPSAAAQKSPTATERPGRQGQALLDRQFRKGGDRPFSPEYVTVVLSPTPAVKAKEPRDAELPPKRDGTKGTGPFGRLGDGLNCSKGTGPFG